jgi:hypothetical protein
MRVFNLTDVSTKQLVQHRLVNQTFELAGKLVAPGEAVEVEGGVVSHPNLRHLLQVGAAATDDLPKAYIKAKAVPAPAPTPPAQEPTGGAVPQRRKSYGG